ncbi:MAG: hypothetical protein ABW217_11340, partial [Polyangiaceae bacterium]
DDVPEKPGDEIDVETAAPSDEPIDEEVPSEPCTPTSDLDLPDEDFLDSNCDGIDGVEARAIFVSSDGFDDAPGTRAQPVQTLAHAIELAATDDRDVYVCNGAYRENVTIAQRVSLYGGYDCARAWRRVKDRAVVESGVGIPLRIEGVAGVVHIERIAFRAPDAIAPGQSSQAGAILDSERVELVRVEFEAGHGAAGADALAGAAGTRATGSGTNGAATAINGCNTYPPQDASCDDLAAGASNSASHECVSVRPYLTRGGAGGRGGNIWLAQGQLTCLEAGSDAGLVGSPGQFFDGEEWRNLPLAAQGRAGADGADGAPAALGIGSVESGVYTASNAGGDGTDGSHGEPGSGGGGGDSFTVGGSICASDAFQPGSGGGQGGAAGCAGHGAAGAGAGGGSIGLVIANSTVVLTLPRIAVGNGGAGGAGSLGGAGSAAKPPGAAGAAATGSVGESGQPGGDGGSGGDGGAGGGGPSVAILYSGFEPAVSEAVYAIGLPGAGGAGKSLGNGAPGVTGELVPFTSGEL